MKKYAAIFYGKMNNNRGFKQIAKDGSIDLEAFDNDKDDDNEQGGSEVWFA